MQILQSAFQRKTAGQGRQVLVIIATTYPSVSMWDFLRLCDLNERK
jgi:hypothetical protein